MLDRLPYSHTDKANVSFLHVSNTSMTNTYLERREKRQCVDEHSPIKGCQLYQAVQSTMAQVSVPTHMPVQLQEPPHVTTRVWCHTHTQTHTSVPLQPSPLLCICHDLTSPVNTHYPHHYLQPHTHIGSITLLGSHYY